MLSRRMPASLMLVLGSSLTLIPIRPALAQARPDLQTGMHSLSDPFSEPGVGLGNGRISGMVRTVDGHAVPDADIVLHDITHSSTFTTTHADPNGSFVFSGLAPGNYDVTASAGVQQANQRVQVPQIGEATVDFRLPNRESAGSGSASRATVSFAHYRVPAKASLYEKAAQLMARGKVDQAFEKANEALSVFPKFPEALTLRGIINEKANKAGEALQDYQLAVQCDAGFPLAYLAMASALNSLGRFSDAMLVLGQVDRIAPDRWEISYEFARASIGKYDFEGALRNIERASQLHGGPQNDSAAIHLVRGYALLGLSNLSKASNEIHAFLAKQPSGRASDAAREVLSRMQSTTTTASR